MRNGRIEVILESSPNCPRCHTILAKAIREMCDALGIPFYEKNLDTDAVAVFERDSTTRTLDENWIMAFGNSRQKQLLRKHAGIVRFLSSRVSFPNLIIRWYDGIRPKELVIRGFPNDENDERIKPFLDNIRKLLFLLRRELYGF